MSQHTPQPVQEKSHDLRNGCLIAVGVVAVVAVLGIVLLFVVGLTMGGSDSSSRAAASDADPASITDDQLQAIDQQLERMLGEEAIGPGTPRGEVLAFRVESREPYQQIIVRAVAVQVQDAIRTEAPGYSGDLRIDFFRTDLDGKLDGSVRLGVDDDINPYDDEG